jgi:heptosyltransferase-1
MSALGDVIQSVPLARFIKDKFPKSEIDWVVEQRFQDLLQRCSFVNKVIPVDMKTWRKNPFSTSTRADFLQFIHLLRKKKYDYLFDIQGNIKSGFVTFFSRSRNKIGFHRTNLKEWPSVLATKKQIKIDPTLPISEQYLQIIQIFFGESRDHYIQPEILSLIKEEEIQIREIVEKGEGRPIIMICPASNWENKRLQDTTWIGLIKRIREKFDPYFFFIFGSDKERFEAEIFHRQFPEDSAVIGALPIAAWQNLMTKTTAVISVDSSALHLAGLASVPTFSIFGPSNGDIFQPSGDIHESFQGACPYGEKFIKRCDHLRTCKTGRCIKGITAEELFERFSNWYQRNQR